MPTTNTAENEELIREYIAASEDHGLDTMEALISDDYTCKYTRMTGEEVQINAENFREFMTGLMNVVSDLNHEIHELVVEGDRVMVRLTWNAIHDGTLYGIEPTDNQVEVEEYNSFRIKDGEIVEQRFLMDDLQFLRQLGLDLLIES